MEMCVKMIGLSEKIIIIVRVMEVLSWFTLTKLKFVLLLCRPAQLELGDKPEHDRTSDCTTARSCSRGRRRRDKDSVDPVFYIPSAPASAAMFVMATYGNGPAVIARGTGRPWARRFLK